VFYPDQARYARLAAAALGVEFRDLDCGNGYVFAVAGNGKQFLSGGGGICSYPINSASSHTIARDKGHTKSVLSHHGVPVIPGRHFFLTDDYVRLRNPGNEAEDALSYAEHIGFPVFCKPLTGGRGNFAEVIRDAAELRDYMARVNARYDAFLIERFTIGDEYRIVVHDCAAIFRVTKGEARMHADGHQSVAQLLARLNDELQGTGVSRYTEASLERSGFTLADVPLEGTVIRLTGRRNLGALGVIESLHIDVPTPLAQLAIAACCTLGLRLGAVDLFDLSPAHDLSELVVIEVNSNPTLAALEQAGHLDLIVGLWTSMIREALEL
jgi:glutathione synthase/RimK-type ligase-like ATP-grasp enzyme